RPSRGPRSRITYTPADTIRRARPLAPRERLVAIPILPFSESPDNTHEAKRRWTLAARPRTHRPRRDPSGRAGRARLPVQPLGPRDRPRQSLRERHGGGRARRAVPRGDE